MDKKSDAFQEYLTASQMMSASTDLRSFADRKSALYDYRIQSVKFRMANFDKIAFLRSLPYHDIKSMPLDKYQLFYYIDNLNRDEYISCLDVVSEISFILKDESYLIEIKNNVTEEELFSITDKIYTSMINRIKNNDFLGNIRIDNKNYKLMSSEKCILMFFELFSGIVYTDEFDTIDHHALHRCLSRYSGFLEIPWCRSIILNEAGEQQIF